MSDAGDVVEELRPGHALFAMVLGYAITFTAAVGLNDYLAVVAPLPPQIGTDLSAVAWVGWFLLVYVAFVFTARIVDAGLHNLYEMLWACNVAMVLGGVGLVSDRPRLVGAAWIMVSLDQTLWWIEVSMRVYRGANHPKRWVIGVAKYLDDPYTTRMKFWTAWHHLWFFPLVLWALRDHGYVPPGSYPLQVYEPKLSAATGTGTKVYMNINLSHKFWKDIHTRSWGTVDRFFASDCGKHEGIVGRDGCRDDFSHIYDNETSFIGCIKYLLWANMILNIVNIGPTLALTLILKILASFS